MKQYFQKYKLQFIMGPAFKLAEAILELFVPIVMSKIIDVGVKNGDTAYILKMGALMFALGAVGLLFAIICQYSAAVAQQGVGTDLRRDVFAKIHALSAADRAKFSNATLVTRLTNDITQIQSGVAMLIRLMFRSPFLIAGSLIMAMALDLRMSVIFLIAGALVSVIMYIVLSRSLPIYKKIQNKLDVLARVVNENLSGVRVIRAFQKTKAERKRFSDENDEFTRIQVRVGRLNAFLNPLTFAVMNLGIVAVLYFGGKNVYAGHLTQGEVIAFTNYMTQILLSIIVFANVIVIFTKAAASMDRVKAVLATEPTMHEGKTETVNTENETAVCFEKVDFSFNTAEEKVLSDISFTVRRGQTVGIIGGTGAGKSALINLIWRLYDTDSGMVSVFGKDVKDYTYHALRNAVHIVPQGGALFKGTVRENLLCGKTDISDVQIETALRVSQAWEFVQQLPEGLNAPVEEGGKNFSGGQRQRLTIARALVGNPEILIFDDASSALDFATDLKLRRALQETYKDKTVIWVSQRVSSVKSADKILLLDDGELCGIGTHEELYRDNELYREICRSQSRESEVGA
ncbi:MAG: ABC transporter ATP-binding protein/permease [Ruminococcus sp.]|nr:ABC transporter ATP-binding protein/permease [Ruminococcus sp.]